MIRVTRSIALNERELTLRFVRASGPGGQNVNKVATAVELRFDAARSPSLPEEVRVRLRQIAGRRMSAAGVLIIDARRHRTQERNRADAVARLVALIAKAATPPRPRHKTKMPKAERMRRLEAKRHRARLKRTRAVSNLD
ncbi:MAG TPA: alternative ribosome rescue aminoacyl-tRNA hydrolase ArfB [Alphaproteobacteria bacterium]|jgi:ribosome-associated protein|nr:alternative ribosome rescue aminoacyl-tRNA hydrolase ArfB [Alphaproteobacteria bacterium]